MPEISKEFFAICYSCLNNCKKNIIVCHWKGILFPSSSNILSRFFSSLALFGEKILIVDSVEFCLPFFSSFVQNARVSLLEKKGEKQEYLISFLKMNVIEINFISRSNSDNILSNDRQIRHMSSWPFNSID